MTEGTVCVQFHSSSQRNCNICNQLCKDGMPNMAILKITIIIKYLGVSVINTTSNGFLVY